MLNMFFLLFRSKEILGLANLPTILC